MTKYFFRIGLPLALLLTVLAACSGAETTGGDPGAAVERYLQALVDRDSTRMIAAACADWESGARLEHDAFAAVTLNLEDVACQQTDEQGDAAVVSCTGAIIANYGAEDLEIDIADRPYRVVREGGEWRMCGYADAEP